ncbi:hypothetical protein VKT23_015853 [Stygiomarasmius scandens]|uniref:Hepcidin n=1 Tax=Marasmiellus scandens TaxID=2682957 RepID=A0ABR1J154_9AGAR
MMRLYSLLLLSVIGACVNAAALNNRDEVGVTTLSESQVLTATKVFPSLVDFEPFMISVTSEVVWTQFPVPTESASTLV